MSILFLPDIRKRAPEYIYNVRIAAQDPQYFGMIAALYALFLYIFCRQV